MEELMDRRQFILGGINRLGNGTLNLLENSLHIPIRWVRPPFAVAEPEFLLTCTRCDACINACSHNALFALRSADFPAATGTPSLNVLDNACYLCEDWPCVEACDSEALVRPADQQALPAFRVSLTINTDRCLPYLGPECGICADACTIPGALQWEMGKPEINMELCIGCAQCRQSCITEPKSISISLHTLPAG